MSAERVTPRGLPLRVSLLSALLLLLASAGCSSTCQVAVGGALWAYDPEKDVSPGADLRLLSASDSDISYGLVHAARKRGIEERLSPVTTATVTARIVSGSTSGQPRQLDLNGDNTFLLLFPEVDVSAFEAVEILVSAPGRRPVRWTMPKVYHWAQRHYDVSMDFVLEQDWRSRR